MIRLMRCLRRRKDVTPADFRRYWSAADYDNLLKQVNEATQAVSHRKNLTLRIDVNKRLADIFGMEDPFDGVIEVFWKDGTGLQAWFETPEGRQLWLNLINHEYQFVDHGQSRVFFTEA